MTLPSNCSFVDGDYLSEVIDALRQQLAATKQLDDLNIAEIERLEYSIRMVESASRCRGIVKKVRPHP